MNNNRWYILTLATLTHTFTVAMPFMCMPVLFQEIADELGLNLVEIGAVWGMIPLGGIFVVLIGGLLGDRFGVKRVLTISCFLAGITGALRGLSGNFFGLSATMFLFGLLVAVIPVNVHKTVSIWFSGRNLGTANGVVSVGMGLGFTVAAMISATVLSPLLGGWRNVLLLFGAMSVVISLLWLFTVRESGSTASSAAAVQPIPFRQAMSRVIRQRDVWFLGLTLFGYLSCLQGMSGYLSLYLRASGWTIANADGSLAAFNAVSTLGTIPLALLSDRLGLRKVILLPSLLITALGIGLLSITTGPLVWFLVIAVGIVRDAFMAIIISMIIEIKGIGATYAGTAVGLVFIFDRLGSFLAPPLGNSLAATNPGLPFVFWGSLALAGALSFIFVRETGHRHQQIPA